MNRDNKDTDWLAVFGWVNTPKLDEARFCACRCHDVVHNAAGMVVKEHQLAVLESEIDNGIACRLCRPKHGRAVFRRRQREAAR